MIKESNARRNTNVAGFQRNLLESQEAFFLQTQWLEQFCIHMQKGAYDKIAEALSSYALYSAVSLEQVLRAGARIPLGQDLQRQHSLLELAQRNRIEDPFFTENDRLLIWVRYLAERQRLFPVGNYPRMIKWLVDFTFMRLPEDRDAYLQTVYEGVLSHYQTSLTYIMDEGMLSSVSFKLYTEALENLKKMPLTKYAEGKVRAPLVSKQSKELQKSREDIEKALRDNAHLSAIEKGSLCRELEQICIQLRLFEQFFEGMHSQEEDSRLQSLYTEYELQADKLFEHMYKGWLYLAGLTNRDILSHNISYLLSLLGDVHKVSKAANDLLRKRNVGIHHHYRHTCRSLTLEQKALLADRQKIAVLSQDETIDPHGFTHNALRKNLTKQMKQLLDLFSQECAFLLQEVAKKGRETPKPGDAQNERKV